MLSFPNTTNQGGMFNDLYDDHGNRIYKTDEKLSQFDVSKIKSFNMNLNATVKKALMSDNNLDISVNSFRVKPKAILGKNFTIFKGEPVESVDNNGNFTTISASNDNANLVTSENPFTIPASILSTVNRYNRIYKTPVNNLMSAGVENSDGSTTSDAGIEIVGLKTKVVSSIFNPNHVIQVNGLLDNLPLMNMESSSNNEEWINVGSYDYLGLEKEKNITFRNVSYNPWELNIDSNGKITGDGPYSGCYYEPETGFIYTEKAQKNDSDGSTTVREYKKIKVDQSDFANAILNTQGNDWRRDGDNVQVKIQYNPFNSKDISNSGNCTIRELVRMSHTPNGQLGMSKFKYADFLFCKYVGKVSNNHMITLRRFAHPVGDNIFRFAGKGYLNKNKPGYHGHQENASIGTLITWFGTDDNKLEDILNYTVKSSWVEFKSKIQQIDTFKEDDESNGLIGLFANSFNPAYNSLVARGMAGSNSLWNKMGSSIFGGVINKATTIVDGSNASSSGTNAHSMEQWELMRMDADKNKIYTPQNTVQDTHKYEGRLELSHEFTLNFSYRLRALDVMNPKTVMLDLIGNILEVTYNRGHFWGGERRFIGPPRNASNIAKSNAFIDHQWENLEGFMMGFANGTLDWKGILSSLSDMVSSAVQAIKGAAEEKGGFANLFLDGAKKLTGKFVSAGASRALLGQLKNSLGRPAVYAMDSLLDGSPVGLWHVTIGNPKNPIAAFGNLIMTGAKITHSGPLGFDDFPTELKVSCTLKHGRSRDLSEVARMYTKGSSAFYNALDKNKLSEFFTVANTNSGRQIETEMTMANYARGLSEQLTSIDSKISNIDQQINELTNKVNETNKAVSDAKQKQKENESSKPDKEPENSADKPKTRDNESKDPKTTTTSTSDNEDINKKQQESQQAQNEINKLKKEKEKLQEQKNTATSELKSGKYSKYLNSDYSMVYGNTDDLQKQMLDTTNSLYQDNAIFTPDYYRRGHFIRDQWALRYETLGQDLDTEGRILIDENA